MYRSVRRGAALLAALVLGLATAQTPAFAQGAYPVVEGTLTALSSTTVTEGGTITITGGGFAPGSTEDITAASAVTFLGTTTADATGIITATVSLADLAPGRHTIMVTGPDATGGELELSLVVVIIAPSSVSKAVLAQTGTHAGELAAFGGASAAAGAALLLIVRRRRSRPTDF